MATAPWPDLTQWDSVGRIDAFAKQEETIRVLAAAAKSSSIATAKQSDRNLKRTKNLSSIQASTPETTTVVSSGELLIFGVYFTWLWTLGPLKPRSYMTD
jgi:hypothetical protein